MTRQADVIDEYLVIGDTPVQPAGREPADALSKCRTILRRWPRTTWAVRLASFAGSVVLVAWVALNAAHGVHFDDENLLPLGASLVFAATSWLLLARAWAVLAGQEPSFLTTGLWARSQALRYVPGGFWAPVSRATTVRGRGITKASTVIAETVLTVAVGAGLGGLLLARQAALWALLLLAPLGVVAAVRIAARRAGLDAARATSAGGWYLASWVAYSVSVVLTQAAVGDVRHILAVAGAGSLARVAGMAALFSPGGVGVREVVYMALVSGFIPADQAAAGAITSRLVLTVAELSVLVALGLPRWWRSHHITSPTRHGTEQNPPQPARSVQSPPAPRKPSLEVPRVEHGVS